MDEGVRNPGAVLGGREGARRVVGADVDVGLGRQACIDDLSRLIDRPHSSRGEPTREVQQHAVVLRIGKDATDRSVERKGDVRTAVVGAQPAKAIDAAVHDA